MTFFLLQSIFLLLLCFVIGYFIARFIKQGLYRRAVSRPGSTAGNSEVESSSGSTARQPDGSDSDATLGSSIEPANLQIIEGIGPRMESVLNENGIETLPQLAAKSLPELQGILDKYGNRYQIIDPTIWLQQARLAAAGEVNKLIELQKIDGVSKLENMMLQDKNSGFARYKQDDLKIIEGIGPKIEALLTNAGINSWQQLSETELSTIKAILRAAGPRYHLAAPESWSLQAKLANRGDWSKLKQIQDRLDGFRPARIERDTAEAI